MASQYHQLPVDASADANDAQPVSSGRWSKKGMALIAGSCVGLVAIVAISTSISTVPSTGAAESTSLLGLTRSFRSPFGGPVMSQPSAAMAPLGASSQVLDKFIASSPWAKHAITAIEATQLGDGARDVAMKAMMRNMDEQEKSLVVKAEAAVANKAKEMVGVTAPLGFFDPWGLSTDVEGTRLMFFREAELKHGRIGMLASLGFFVGEKFHPLWGGNLDMPAVFAPQNIPSQSFWPLAFIALAIPEILTANTMNWQYGYPTMKDEKRVPGDMGFDPLGLKPKSDKEFRVLQEKELNNGRLAMLAAAGAIAQEWATGKSVF